MLSLNYLHALLGANKQKRELWTNALIYNEQTLLCTYLIGIDGEVYMLTFILHGDIEKAP